MDKVKLSEALGMHPHGMMWVQSVRLSGWGGEVVFDLLYEPGAPAKPVPFQLRLEDCRDLQWRVYAHVKPAADGLPHPTSLVNLRLGTSEHRKPLQLLTDAFGITISYGQLTIERASS